MLSSKVGGEIQINNFSKYVSLLKFIEAMILKFGMLNRVHIQRAFSIGVAATRS